jgi:hypothetical protein
VQHVLGALAVGGPLQDGPPARHLLLRRLGPPLQLAGFGQQPLGGAGPRLGPLELLAQHVQVAGGAKRGTGVEWEG